MSDMVVGRFVTPSWIVDNDPGDEDPSVVPERRVIVEITAGPIIMVGGPQAIATESRQAAGDPLCLPLHIETP